MPQSDKAPASAAKLQAICRDFPLSEPAKSLATGEPAPLAYLELLMDHGLFRDTFLLMAAWLPKREAVWWGCLCAWCADRPEPPPPVAAAYQAVVSWVLAPTEANRRAAEAAGRATGRKTLGAALAQAVLYSEGSISGPDLPPVLPPENLSAQVIANAVFHASLRGDRARKVERQRQFLRIGLQVIHGKSRWQPY